MNIDDIIKRATEIDNLEKTIAVNDKQLNCPVFKAASTEIRIACNNYREIGLFHHGPSLFTVDDWEVLTNRLNSTHMAFVRERLDVHRQKLADMKGGLLNTTAALEKIPVFDVTVNPFTHEVIIECGDDAHDYFYEEIDEWFVILINDTNYHCHVHYDEEFSFSVYPEKDGTIDTSNPLPVNLNIKLSEK